MALSLSQALLKIMPREFGLIKLTNHSLTPGKYEPDSYDLALCSLWIPWADINDTGSFSRSSESFQQISVLEGQRFSHHQLYVNSI